MATREAWLLDAVDKMRPWFDEADKPLPENIHVSIGFASRKKAIGQCWQPQASAKGVHEIFICPTHPDDVTMLDTLVHELCHAALPGNTGHRKPFAKLAEHVGLLPPWTATHAGDELKSRLNAIIEEIGPSPHGQLSAACMPKKQTTRLRLFECDCGTKVRLARDEFHATCDDCGSQFERKQ